VPQPALVEPLRRWDPEQVGGYVLVGRLGAGAMGRVYLGRSAAGRLVAVKTIKVELAEEPDFRTRFGQEVAAARRVSGAFTAAVVAADPDADVPWLATAYVPAPSLSTLVLTCGPLPVPAVRWLAAGCAEALESIHGAGLVHRDLKPSNVLVSLDGPRVIDFGVARAAERIQLTVTRGAVGTPAYMAPEQARDTRQATMASDVFSLGGTMLFAATGHAPYQGETVMDVLVRLATEAPDLSGLPGDLAEIVMACLQRDPRRRPSSAAVLAGLAPFISLAADGPGPGAGALPGAAARSGATAMSSATSLPGAALALMADYRRDPRPAAEAAAATGEDATFGSQPALSGTPGGGSPGGSVHGGARSGLARSGGAIRGYGASSAAPRRRRVLLALASAAAAAALVVAGVVIGASVAGSRSQSAVPPPPPGGFAPQPPPGSAVSTVQGGKPEISMSQATGDSRTGFVVFGGGWAPGSTVTIRLAGVPAPPEHAVTDRVGNFSYSINQDHEFFPGGLPVRAYRMVVTAPRGASASATFTVGRR
jgi:Protein kinase domain